MKNPNITIVPAKTVKKMSASLYAGMLAEIKAAYSKSENMLAIELEILAAEVASGKLDSSRFNVDGSLQAA